MKQTALKVLTAVFAFACLAYLTYAGTYLARTAYSRVSDVQDLPPETAASSHAETEPAEDEPGDEQTVQLPPASVPSGEPPPPAARRPLEPAAKVEPRVPTVPVREQISEPEPRRAVQVTKPPVPPVPIADAGPTYDEMRTKLDRAQKVR